MNEKDLDNLFGDNKEEKNEDSNKSLSSPPLKLKKNRNIPELTNKQIVTILKFWENNPDDPPSVEQILEKIFPGQKLDGRSIEGYWIKSIIVKHNLPPAKTKTKYSPKGLLPLTPEMQEYIKNNPNMTAKDIACILWEKSFLMNNSQEVRTVLNYQKELEKEGNFHKEINDDDLTEEYRPPKTIDHTCARINKYVRNLNLDVKKINEKEKRNCRTLISYLHDYHLNHQLNEYRKLEDRDLFESTFIKYTYDKSDLTQEDIGQYIILATEVVIGSNILRTIDMLQQEQDNEIKTNSKISMALVEAINTARTEYNASIKRQDTLYKTLTATRSKRLDGKIKETATVMNLFELWRNEETRIKMIKLANKKKEKLKEEIEKLENMDDLICIIAGLDKSEVLNG